MHLSGKIVQSAATVYKQCGVRFRSQRCVAPFKTHGYNVGACQFQNVHMTKICAFKLFLGSVEDIELQAARCDLL